MKQKKMNKTERSWAVYDCGCSAFSMLLTAIIPIYIKAIGGGIGFSDADTTAHWGMIQSVSTLAVALLAPVLGAMADFKGRKKVFFNVFLFAAVLSLFAMSFADNYYVLLIINFIAYVGYAGSNTFYDAFLTDVTTDGRMDYVSSVGFGLGYIASCVPFLISILLVLTEPFGLTGTLPVKASFVINAVWWLLWTLPMLRNVRQRYGVDQTSDHWIRDSFSMMLQTGKRIWKNRNMRLFLLAYFFYIDGVDTIITMSTSFGTDVGIDSNQMIVALLVTQIVAFPSVIVCAKIAQRMSSHTVIMFSLVLYIGICIFGFFLEQAWQFWVLAVAVAIVQGTIQALSRSYFGRLIPEKEHSNEYFGFYNILGRYAAVIGPMMMAVFTMLTGESRWGVLSIAALFVIALAIFRCVPAIKKDV